MKHRADVLQIERPGSVQTGGRHAVAKKKGRTRVSGKNEDVLEVEVAPVKDTAPKPAPETPDRVTTLDPIEPEAVAAVLETSAHHPHEGATAPTLEEQAASPLTSAGKWRTRNLLRSLTFLLLIASAVVTGLTGRLYFESTTDSRMRLFVTTALIMAGLWALLTATAPQVVTLRGSILTVRSRRGTDSFDLAEGMQQIELVGEPGTSKWALVLHRGDNSTVRLGRRDVDCRTVDPLVRQFREIAERRRSEHWARLGL